MKPKDYLFLLIALPISCNFLSRDKTHVKEDTMGNVINIDSIRPLTNDPNIVLDAKAGMKADTLTHLIDTRNVTPDQLVEFARSLLGTPYRYASIDPASGFDCSGFITYVFNHFNIKVPRSSIDFTNVGVKILPANSRVGDIILFTGTDSTNKSVGHMGIIVSNQKDSIQFIHSSSGKANGVVISPLATYYKSRFVKVIRVFKESR